MFDRLIWIVLGYGVKILEKVGRNRKDTRKILEMDFGNGVEYTI